MHLLVSRASCLTVPMSLSTKSSIFSLSSQSMRQWPSILCYTRLCCTPLWWLHRKTWRVLPSVPRRAHSASKVCCELDSMAIYLCKLSIICGHTYIVHLLPVILLYLLLPRLCFVLVWTAPVQQYPKESAVLCAQKSPLCLRNVL